MAIHWSVTPSQAELVAEGRELFLNPWVPDDELSGGGDGLGPVFNGQLCIACHFKGGVGGQVIRGRTSRRIKFCRIEMIEDFVPA